MALDRLPWVADNRLGRRIGAVVREQVVGRRGLLHRLCLFAFRNFSLGLRFRFLAGFHRRLLAVGENFGDADQRVFVAIAALAARVLAAALLERNDLVAALMRDDFGRNSRTGHRVAEDGGVAADHQDIAELDDRARRAVEAGDLEGLFGGDAVLLAAGFDDCEHGLAS